MKLSINNLLLVITLILFSQKAFGAKLNIVSSIKPIDSLVRMISGDNNENQLLISGNQSPHGFVIRPSDIEMINKADIIFYIDDSFEDFLRNILDSANNLIKIPLLQKSNLNLLNQRNNLNWKSKKVSMKTKAPFPDPHVWLDTRNAQKILKTITEELIRIDPEKEKIYEANYKSSIDRIDDLNKSLKDKLKKQKGSFMVYHDGFHYFEEQFNLNNVGAITFNPQNNISIKSLRRNMTKAEDLSVKCIFNEPQFNKKFSYMVAKRSSARVIEIDPIGFDLNPSSNLYSKLMMNASNAFVKCLSGF